jgi:hypothetical protein
MQYNTLPENVKAILDSHCTMSDEYQECERLISELNEIGWNADYDLEGNLFNIHQM